MKFSKSLKPVLCVLMLMAVFFTQHPASVVSGNSASTAGTISSSSMLEEAPPGYYFPYEDGSGLTPDTPIPYQTNYLQSSSGALGAYVETSFDTDISSQAKEGFDLGDWLLKTQETLNKINDPAMLHQMGQAMLSYQRGPLVDELALRFLEKASALAPGWTWTANNYAVQKFSNDGISEKSYKLFEEAKARAFSAGENASDSASLQNSHTYETLTQKVQNAINELFSHSLAAPNDTEARLKLVQYLIFTNRLNDTQAQLAQIPKGNIFKFVLEGQFLQKIRDFAGAATAFHSAVESFEKSASTNPEFLSQLKRTVVVLEENHRASLKLGRTTSEIKASETIINPVVSTTLDEYLSRQGGEYQPSAPFTAQVTVRAASRNPFYLTLSGMRFEGKVSTDPPSVFRYLATSNVPFLFYGYQTIVSVRDGGAGERRTWIHKVKHPDLIGGVSSAIIGHPANRNVRISWNFI